MNAGRKVMHWIHSAAKIMEWIAFLSLPLAVFYWSYVCRRLIHEKYYAAADPRSRNADAVLSGLVGGGITGFFLMPHGLPFEVFRVLAIALLGISSLAAMLLVFNYGSLTRR